MGLDTHEFLQDFLAETDELLLSIRQNLMALETDENASTHGAHTTLVNELFRAFHTLKGISGMMGLSAAAELSHAMESTLDALRKQQLAVSTEVVDHLLEGTNALEDIIATLTNDEAPEVDIQPHLEALRQLRAAAESIPEPTPNIFSEESLPQKVALPPEIAADLKPADWERLHAAVRAGRALTLARFSPSPEKNAAGINVTHLRKQFEAQDLLLQALPLIHGNTVEFIFLLASEEPLRAEQFPDVELTPIALQEASEPAAKTEARRGQTPPARGATSLRVDIARLDEIMWLVGDLVVARSRLEALRPQLRGAPPHALEALAEVDQFLERRLRYLRQAVMRARMVPLAEAFSRMPLVVRDLARASKKQVELLIEGENTEIDKSLVERLLDPLLHLVRNAIAHGIEPPEERHAAGKPPQGKLTISGTPEGDYIHIRVSDDGRGIDLEKIAALARRRGWLEDESVITTEEALEFICRPDFSTRQQADLGSGRGVGMDVVLQTARDLGGELSMETTPGQGTTFHLRIPLTLTILHAILVVAGDERYAVPRSAIERVMKIPAAAIVYAEGAEIISLDGQPAPLLTLRTLFGLTGGSRNGQLVGLVTTGAEGKAILAVDRVEGMQEVVIRSINDPLAAQPGIAGATELGDGSVVLILDVPALYRLARRQLSGKRRNAA